MTRSGGSFAALASAVSPSAAWRSDETCALQVSDDDLGNGEVVVDDEHTGHEFRVSPVQQWHRTHVAHVRSPM